MGFDRSALEKLIARHGPVARIVVARTKGSVPRGPGAAMLVWQDGQSGTIGGGALEYQATAHARQELAANSGESRRLSSHPLGPELGQCCGGYVELLTEVFTEQNLPQKEALLFARAIEPNSEKAAPLAVTRATALARSQGKAPPAFLVDGWMIEPLTGAAQPLWIWGAGHVGRALVQILAPLNELEIIWVDTAKDRFPQNVPLGVTVLPVAEPAAALRHASAQSTHLIVTYSHALDFELCHQLLSHNFGWAGLIGSATKWARFRRRLQALGHSNAQISRIICPIGRPEYGKQPAQIAIGVAADLLERKQVKANEQGRRA
ncbi:MAG: xanthine dehydrogenase accessory protein XdhC [Paracoccaceae bacterium]|nr:xanthine dehydrogenase accessory protein XdhC [Paracoccaceae bacterium]